MVGGYDDILQPLVIDDRFDYILFSNEIKEPQIGVWQIRPIQYYNSDRTRICRYVKTHPEELIPEYEISIWMDASMQILSQDFYDIVSKLEEQKVLISSMCHPVRTCIYQEAFAVVNMMVEHEKVVIDWCHLLRKEEYPQHNGLCETGVIFRMRNELIHKANTFWWKCIEKYSRRDQLSFNYVLWKLNIPCHYFFGEGKNVRNIECLRLMMHNDIDHNNCSITDNEAWLMRHCWKHKSETDKVECLYYKIYGMPFPHILAYLLGQFYRIIDRIKQ